MQRYIWEFNDEAKVFFAKLDTLSTVYSKNPPYNPIGEFSYRHNKSFSRFSIRYRSGFYNKRGFYRNFYGEIKFIPSGIIITERPQASWIGCTFQVCFVMLWFALAIPDILNNKSDVFKIVFSFWGLLFVSAFLISLLFQLFFGSNKKTIILIDSICNT